MNTHSLLKGCLAMGLGLTIRLTPAAPVGTAFTYQGRLSTGGNPANGVYDLTFALFDASIDGNGLGGSLTNSATVISNGLFAATLDFGSNVFNGAGLWLQIGVRTNSGGSFTLLNPRQMLTPAPYAITAGNVTGPVNGASIVSGTITGTQLASNSIAASQLAPGAAAANLMASGQLGVPTGGVILSTNPSVANLLSAGYCSLGEVHTADQWRPGNTDKAGQADAQSGSMVWTGNEVLLWGGQYGNNYPVGGGRYNPSSDSWTAMSTNGAPAGRSFHTTVWTGSEMIVWGGLNQAGPPNYTTTYYGDGARYNPTTDTWSPLSASGAPSPRFEDTAVWTGNEMIIWGGRISTPSNRYYNDGARYSPANDTWTAVSTNGAPAARSYHVAVWMGSEMLVWGGYDVLGNFLSDGGRYNPASNTWTPINSDGMTRQASVAFWSGSDMVVWGSGSVRRYNPTNDTWGSSGCAVPTGGLVGCVVWTDAGMMIWGGSSLGGACINLAACTLTTMTVAGAPTGNGSDTRGVWTGSEMIVYNGSLYRYAPSKTLYLYSKP
jgi:N-acetylneuraminic acid mutarotase